MTYAKATDRERAAGILQRLRRVIEVKDACQRLGLSLGDWHSIEEGSRDESGRWLAKASEVAKVLRWADAL